MGAIRHPGPTRRALLAAGLALPALGARAAAGGAAATTLTVTAFPLVDEIVRAALPSWRLQHPDVDIKVMSRQYADHHTAMTTALSTSGLLPDVMVLESGFVGRFAQGGGLEDLAAEPYGIGRFRPHLVPYAYDQAIGRNGAVVAMPADIGPGTMLHRTDVLDKAGVSEADLTRSWASYLEAGQRIRERTGAHLVSHVQTVKDILIRTGVRPGDSLYFDRDSRVLVESDRFIRAFEIAREIRRHKLDARVTAWSNEWAEGLRRGSLATELSGAWMVGQLSTWVAPATRGLWRASDMPEGAAVSYGGAFYALPRRAAPERKAMAWALVQHMTLDAERQLAAFKAYDAFPALLATHDDPFFDEPMAFLGGQPARRLWRDTARRITATRVHKQNAFADEVIGTELDKVLDRGKDIRVALADARRLLERRAHR